MMDQLNANSPEHFPRSRIRQILLLTCVISTAVAVLSCGQTPTATEPPVAAPTSTEPPAPSPLPTSTTTPPPSSYVFDYVPNQDGINAQGTPLPPGDECWDRTTGMPGFVGQVKNAQGDVVWGARVEIALEGASLGYFDLDPGGYYTFLPAREWAGKGYVSFLDLDIPEGKAVLSQEARELRLVVEYCKKRIDFIERLP